MTMRDWRNKLDAFLEFNEYNVLKSSGSISHKVAKALAEEEFSIFRPIQDRDFLSDFDQTIATIASTGKLNNSSNTPKKNLSEFNKSLSTTLSEPAQKG